MNDREQGAVLVTGARGFIGRATGKLLQRSGYRVILLDQNAPAASAGDEHTREIVCDIRDRDQLRRVFEEERIAEIIHLAAILPTAAQREPLLATQVNVEGSLHLLELARQFGVRRLLFASSLSVYGTCAADQVVSEADRAAPEDLYGAAKVYVEQLGADYRERYGLDFVSLRIGRVVGPGAHSATSAWRSQIFELLNTPQPAEIELPYAAPERILLVHVDDVAKMLLMLLRAIRLAHLVYNACCQSVIVGELQHRIESLNPRIRAKIGDAQAVGNPRLLDFSRFASEFDFKTVSIFNQLQGAINTDAR